MKHALLLSGQPIFYKECYNSMINIPKINGSKHYAHLWWDNFYKGKRNKMHFIQTYNNSDNIDVDFCEKYNIDVHDSVPHIKFDQTFMKKFNYETWPNTDLKWQRFMNPIITYGNMCQSYSAYQSFKLSSNDHIDVYIKSRPDIIYTKPLGVILNSLKCDDINIYFQCSMDGGHLYAGEFPYRPCDWFFVGSKAVMEKFLYSWHYMIPEEYENGMIHTNEFVKIICAKNGLKLNMVDFGALIYKQTNDFYDNFLVKPEFYIQDFNIDKQYPDNPDLWPYWIDKVNFEHFRDIR